MFETMLLTLNRWNTAKTERQKLQHTLLALTVIIVVVAGLLSLVNVNLGHDVVLVSVFTLASFVANALVYNLLQAALLAKLSSKPKRR